MDIRFTVGIGKVITETEMEIIERLKNFLELETHSCSMGLTLLKSLTLGKTQVNLALLSQKRDFRVRNTSVCV